MILQDLTRNSLGKRPTPFRCVTMLVTARYRAVFLFRVSQWLGAHRLSVVADLVKQVNHSTTGADLAWQARVGNGLILYHPVGVVFGPDIVVGHNCTVQQGVTLGGRAEGGSATVGRNVFLGAGCKVLGNVVLGDDVTVGANAVVLRDIPDGKVAVGVPARIIEK